MRIPVRYGSIWGTFGPAGRIRAVPHSTSARMLGTNGGCWRWLLKQIPLHAASRMRQLAIRLIGSHPDSSIRHSQGSVIA